LNSKKRLTQNNLKNWQNLSDAKNTVNSLKIKFLIKKYSMNKHIKIAKNIPIYFGDDIIIGEETIF
jgi:hypothetical protein